MQQNWSFVGSLFFLFFRVVDLMMVRKGGGNKNGSSRRRSKDRRVGADRRLDAVIFRGMNPALGFPLAGEHCFMRSVDSWFHISSCLLTG